MTLMLLFVVPSGMSVYSRPCRRSLWGHGDDCFILESNGAFDEAIADFASAYSNLNGDGHAALQATGRVKVTMGP